MRTWCRLISLFFLVHSGFTSASDLFPGPTNPSGCTAPILMAEVQTDITALIDKSNSGRELVNQAGSLQGLTPVTIELIAAILVDFSARIGRVRNNLATIEKIPNLREQVSAGFLDRLRELNTLCHDVIGPLNAMSLTVAIAQDFGMGELLESDFGVFQRGFTHGLESLEQIEKLVRGENPTFKKTQFDLVDVLTEVSGLQRIYKQEGVNFVVEMPPSPIRLWGNQRLLTEAVMNLTNNARDAIVKTGRPGGIVVSVGVDQAHIHIKVRDDGPGMPEDFIARALSGERPTTNAPVGPVQRGVGLGSVLHTADMHGGTVEVESCQIGPTTGTTVTLHLAKIFVLVPE
jgi:signal transduction histidine kinase